jgi:hypothetical protein
VDELSSSPTSQSFIHLHRGSSQQIKDPKHQAHRPPPPPSVEVKTALYLNNTFLKRNNILYYIRGLMYGVNLMRRAWQIYLTTSSDMMAIWIVFVVTYIFIWIWYGSVVRWDTMPQAATSRVEVLMWSLNFFSLTNPSSSTRTWGSLSLEQK